MNFLFNRFKKHRTDQEMTLLCEPLEPRQMLSSVQIFAAGYQGGEEMLLQIGDDYVQSWIMEEGGVEAYTYNSPDNVEANQVRIWFTNDQYDPSNGIDLNLIVDRVEIDGVRFDAEDGSVFSTGTWLPEDGIVSGFRKSEYLHTNGYFQFANETVPDSYVLINARGDVGGEQFNLVLDGKTVETYTVGTSNQQFLYNANDIVTADDVRIEYINDNYDPVTGIDYNLTIDYILIDGQSYHAESPNVFSTGGWTPEDGIVSGFRQSERLLVNGYFQFSESEIDQDARYQLTFTSTWSAATHPNDFPSFPHFSGLIGATHDSGAEFWTPGQTATTGIQDVAEVGSKTALSNEILTEISEGDAQYEITGGGISTLLGSVTVEFDISTDFHLVTVVSMLAPSPDWFVGVHGISLLDDSGVWLASTSFDLFAYDAGTDSGLTFESVDQVTSPQGVVSLITTGPLANNGIVLPVGRFTFERIG